MWRAGVSLAMFRVVILRSPPLRPKDLGEFPRVSAHSAETIKRETSIRFYPGNSQLQPGSKDPGLFSCSMAAEITAPERRKNAATSQAVCKKSDPGQAPAGAKEMPPYVSSLNLVSAKRNILRHSNRFTVTTTAAIAIVEAISKS